jgi:hypothetical protein
MAEPETAYSAIARQVDSRSMSVYCYLLLSQISLNQETKQHCDDENIAV